MNGREMKTETIHVLVEPSVKQAALQMAVAAERTMSGYVRQLIKRDVDHAQQEGLI